jgi:hypothetical protein
MSRYRRKSPPCFNARNPRALISAVAFACCGAPIKDKYWYDRLQARAVGGSGAGSGSGVGGGAAAAAAAAAGRARVAAADVNSKDDRGDSPPV